MKPLLLACALLLAPVAAHAQVAAGTVPNTFDGPRNAAQITAPAAAPVRATAPADAASEETLRTLIAGAQAGAMDYSLLTEGLAEQIRGMEAEVTPLIQGFGEVVSVGFVDSQDGIDAYEVLFANAATQWLIGMNDEGKVSALRFRPAE